MNNMTVFSGSHTCILQIFKRNAENKSREIFVRIIGTIIEVPWLSYEYANFCLLMSEFSLISLLIRAYKRLTNLFLTISLLLISSPCNNRDSIFENF